MLSETQTYIGLALYVAVWLFIAMREFKASHSMTGIAIIALVVVPIIGLVMWMQALSSMFGVAEDIIGSLPVEPEPQPAVV